MVNLVTVSTVLETRASVFTLLPALQHRLETSSLKRS